MAGCHTLSAVQQEQRDAEASHHGVRLMVPGGMQRIAHRDAIGSGAPWFGKGVPTRVPQRHGS